MFSATVYDRRVLILLPPYRVHPRLAGNSLRCFFYPFRRFPLFTETPVTMRGVGCATVAAEIFGVTCYADLITSFCTFWLASSGMHRLVLMVATSLALMIILFFNQRSFRLLQALV
jgi:hypothetical protein